MRDGKELRDQGRSDFCRQNAFLATKPCTSEALRRSRSLQPLWPSRLRNDDADGTSCRKAPKTPSVLWSQLVCIHIFTYSRYFASSGCSSGNTLRQRVPRREPRARNSAASVEVDLTDCRRSEAGPSTATLRGRIGDRIICTLFCRVCQRAEVRGIKTMPANGNTRVRWRLQYGVPFRAGVLCIRGRRRNPSACRRRRSRDGRAR